MIYQLSDTEVLQNIYPITVAKTIIPYARSFIT